MARRVRIGIIGMGKIGEVHARALLNVPGAEIAAVCDADAKRLSALGEDIAPGRRYRDCRELVRQPDLDAVVVATPNFTHSRYTLDALAAGKHVFCEKPMALNAREAFRMVEAARKARRRLQIGMVCRFRSESVVAREYVRKGCLGRVYHMQALWRRKRGIPGLGGWFTTRAKSGGGVMIDIGVHLLDLVMWLSGLWNPTRVAAATYSKFGCRMRDYVFTRMWAGPPNYKGVFDVEDYAAGLIRFGADATLRFEFSWAANCREEMFVELLGDRGGLRLEFGQPVTIVTEYGGRVATVTPEYPETQHFDLQAENFVNAVRGRADPGATGEEGAIVMSVIDAIYRSATVGREVPVRTSGRAKSTPR